MTTGAIVGLVIGGVLLLLVIAILLWLVLTYNSFVKMRNDVDEGFSTMDVYLKKRYDLIPNIVNTVKGYAKHESETLDAVISARNSAMASKNAEEQLKNENILSGTLKSLFALSENYPDLKANANFLNLQENLQSIEDEIATSRKYYNGVVKIYDTKREVFPSNCIAKWFNFEKRPLYEIENTEERENLKVEF